MTLTAMNNTNRSEMALAAMK